MGFSRHGKSQMVDTESGYSSGPLHEFSCITERKHLGVDELRFMQITWWFGVAVTCVTCTSCTAEDWTLGWELAVKSWLLDLPWSHQLLCRWPSARLTQQALYTIERWSEGARLQRIMKLLAQAGLWINFWKSARDFRAGWESVNAIVTSKEKLECHWNWG